MHERNHTDRPTDLSAGYEHVYEACGVSSSIEPETGENKRFSDDDLERYAAEARRQETADTASSQTPAQWLAALVEIVVALYGRAARPCDRPRCPLPTAGGVPK